MYITKINRADVGFHLPVFERQPHQFVVCASDLGWRHGDFWPDRVETDLGNGRPFVFQSADVVDGELQATRYQQELGCITLTVLND